MSDIAFGILLLSLGLGMTWLTVLQYRRRDASGETIFDVVGAIIPALERPMFWASTVFVGLLAIIALIGAGAFFMRALSLD